MVGLVSDRPFWLGLDCCRAALLWVRRTQDWRVQEARPGSINSGAGREHRCDWLSVLKRVDRIVGSTSNRCLTRREKKMVDLCRQTSDLSSVVQTVLRLVSVQRNANPKV